MLAAVADYLINSGIVTLYVAIKTGLAPWAVMKELRIGRLSEFLDQLLGTGVPWPCSRCAVRAGGLLGLASGFRSL